MYARLTTFRVKPDKIGDMLRWRQENEAAIYAQLGLREWIGLLDEEAKSSLFPSSRMSRRLVTPCPKFGLSGSRWHPCSKVRQRPDSSSPEVADRKPPLSRIWKLGQAALGIEKGRRNNQQQARLRCLRPAASRLGWPAEWLSVSAARSDHGLPCAASGGQRHSWLLPASKRRGGLSSCECRQVGSWI